LAGSFFSVIPSKVHNLQKIKSISWLPERSEEIIITIKTRRQNCELNWPTGLFGNNRNRNTDRILESDIDNIDKSRPLNLKLPQQIASHWLRRTQIDCFCPFCSTRVMISQSP